MDLAQVAIAQALRNRRKIFRSRKQPSDGSNRSDSPAPSRGSSSAISQRSLKNVAKNPFLRRRIPAIYKKQLNRDKKSSLRQLTNAATKTGGDIPFATAARSAYSNQDPPDGYTLANDFDGVRVFERNGTGSEKHFIIAHRGSENLRDIKSDAMLALGKYSSVYEARLKMTGKAIRAIRKKFPNAKIYMAGHSLGGTTANYAMRDKYVQNNVDQTVVFNMGASPLLPQPLAPDTQHYSARGDVVSLFASSTERKFNTPKSIINTVATIGNPMVSVPTGLLAVIKAHSIDNF